MEKNEGGGGLLETIQNRKTEKRKNDSMKTENRMQNY